MENTLEIENVKNYLRSLYHANNPQEAEGFFQNIIESDTDCSTLFDILMSIIIEEEDHDLKKISIILIRKMDFSFIIESIFFLNQNIDFDNIQTIEILTDYLAEKQNDQLISLIDEKIKSDDILIQNAVVQLLSSIEYKIKNNKIKPKEFKAVWPRYYECLIQTVNLIMLNRMTANEIIFLYYFILSFDEIIKFSEDYAFFHNVACFCLSQKISGKIFNYLIDNILLIYSKLMLNSINEMPIAELLNNFADYCQSTGNIPTNSLYFWNAFFKRIDEINPFPTDFSDLIINFVFPFIQFRPSIIKDNPEQFLNEFSPEADVPLYELFAGLSLSPEFPDLSDFVFQYADFYFQEYIDHDIYEICRLLVFVSRFSYCKCDQNENYICEFYHEKIFPMIDQIDLTQSDDVCLAMAICEFIRTVYYENDEPIFESDEISILVEFVKKAVLFEFENDDNEYVLLFFFAINAISKKFITKRKYIDLFNFTEEETYTIFLRTLDLNKLIQTFSINELLKIEIESLRPPDISDSDFVEIIWDLCISLKGRIDSFLLGKYVEVLKKIFQNCKKIEEKELIFESIFKNLSNEVENAEGACWLITDCYEFVLSLLVEFADQLMSPSNVPLFMDTVGDFIKNMLFSINHEIIVSSEISLTDMATEYMLFTFSIIGCCNDPEYCIDRIIVPFIFEVVAKLNDLIDEEDNEGDESFTFESLSSPLIKFKGDENIFKCYYDFYSILFEMRCVDQTTKSDLLALLIYSDPSFLFENFDQEQIYNKIESELPESTSFIHILAIREILIYLSNEDNNNDFIELITTSFYQRVEDERYFDEDGNPDYDPLNDYDARLYYENHIFREDFIKIINEIKKYVSE